MAVKKEEKEASDRLLKEISINIRKYRKERNLTQEKLAEYANISYDYMRRIESRTNNCGFSIYTLYKLSLALGVTMDELANKEEKELTR